MGKSIRSKAKRAFRGKKREDSVYAVADAARHARLSAKLSALAGADLADFKPPAAEEGADEGEDAADVELADGAEVAEVPAAHSTQPGASMDVDSVPKKVSTHGPRQSRREQWRESKGLTPRPKAKGNGMSRQGIPAGKRKAGRPQRRR